MTISYYLFNFIIYIRNILSGCYKGKRRAKLSRNI